MDQYEDDEAQKHDAVIVRRADGETFSVDLTRSLDAGSSSAQVAQLRLLGEIANALWAVVTALEGDKR